MLGVVSQVCHYCRKFRLPAEVMKLPGGALLCQECYQRHAAATLALSGLKANSDGTFASVAPPPAECSECHLTYEELCLRAGRADVAMALHYENGLYRFLCEKCSSSYVPKRRDLYGDTQFGHQQKLK